MWWIVYRERAVANFYSRARINSFSLKILMKWLMQTRPFAVYSLFSIPQSAYATTWPCQNDEYTTKKCEFTVSFGYTKNSTLFVYIQLCNNGKPVVWRNRYLSIWTCRLPQWLGPTKWESSLHIYYSNCRPTMSERRICARDDATMRQPVIRTHRNDAKIKWATFASNVSDTVCDSCLVCLISNAYMFFMRLHRLWEA